MIVRVQRRPRWTTIAATIPEDTRLSYGALGLLVYLLSRPDNWEIQMPHLAQSRDTTGYAVKKLLRELRSAGYAVLVTTRSADGTLAGSEYLIREDPDAPVDNERPDPLDAIDDDAPSRYGGPGVPDAPPAMATASGVRGGALSPPEQDYVDTFGADVLRGLPMYSRDLLSAMVDDLSRRSVFHAWAGNGWRPTSLSSMFDLYQTTVAANAAGAGDGEAARSTGRDDVTAGSVANETNRAADLLRGFPG